MAESADSKEQEHLRSLLRILLQKKLKEEKSKLRGGLSGEIIDTVVMRLGMNKPENSRGRRAAVKTAHDWQETTEKIAQIEEEYEKINDSLASKKGRELYQLVEDLMNNKPIFKTEPKVRKAIGIPVDSKPPKI